MWKEDTHGKVDSFDGPDCEAFVAHIASTTQYLMAIHISMSATAVSPLSIALAYFEPKIFQKKSNQHLDVTIFSPRSTLILCIYNNFFLILLPLKYASLFLFQAHIFSMIFILFSNFLDFCFIGDFCGRRHQGMEKKKSNKSKRTTKIFASNFD